MKLLIKINAFILVFLATQSSLAGLHDRGKALVYDDVLDITWMLDMNHAMTTGYAGNNAGGVGSFQVDGATGWMGWDAAKTFAASVSYQGLSGWRLPKCLSGGCVVGASSNNSEIGHMIHTHLGVAADGMSQHSQFYTNDEQPVLLSLINPSTTSFWYEDAVSGDPDKAWTTFVGAGSDDPQDKAQANLTLAWLVRDGDVMTDPDFNSGATSGNWLSDEVTSDNGGTILVDSLGAFIYTPAAGFVGADTFTYTTAGSDGNTSTSTVTINVTVNNLPDAVDDSFEVDEDTVLTGSLMGNDDLGNEPTAVTGFDSTSTRGGAVLVGTAGGFTYTPEENFNGIDQFTYSITDGDGESDTATVDINVAPVADSLNVAIDVRYVRSEANEINQASGVVLGGQLAGDGNIYGTDGLNITETPDPTVIHFGAEFVGATVELNITVQIDGSWNWDAGTSGDSSYFDDNWTLAVNENFIGSFWYNSNSTVTEGTLTGPNGPIYTHGTAGTVNGNMSFTDVVHVQNVVVNTEGNVVFEYTAATTSTDEIVTIQSVTAIDLPDTYIYEVDISAGLTAPGETLTVQLSGTNSGVLTSTTGDTIVTENPAGSGMWDITFDPADASSISDVLEIRILDGVSFQLDLIATSVDGGDSVSATVSSAPD